MRQVNRHSLDCDGCVNSHSELDEHEGPRGGQGRGDTYRIGIPMAHHITHVCLS